MESKIQKNNYYVKSTINSSFFYSYDQQHKLKYYKKNYKYPQISSIKINNDNVKDIKKIKKLIPLRTTSLYAISSANNTTTTIKTANNYDADDDDDEKDYDDYEEYDNNQDDEIIIKNQSSVSHSLPQLKISSKSSSLSFRNGLYHQSLQKNIEGNKYRLNSTYSHHRQFLHDKNSFLSSSVTHYPSIKMTSIVDRRSSSVEKESTAALTTGHNNYQNNHHHHHYHNHQHHHHQSNGGVLREKICNNEILNGNNELTSPTSSPPSWVRIDDVDVIKEKIRGSDRNHYNHYNRREQNQQHQQQQHNNHQKNSEIGCDRYRHSESEKFNVVDSSIKKRSPGLRIRSESEPNDISSMRHWMPQVAITTVDEEIYKKTNNEKQNLVEKEKQQRSSLSHKLPPKYPHSHCNNNKRKTPSPPLTPPRLSIYSSLSRSPGIVRKLPSSSSSFRQSRFPSIGGSTVPAGTTTTQLQQNSQRSSRSNGVSFNSSPRRRSTNSAGIATSSAATRRCRTKSPSPTSINGDVGNKYHESTSVSFRKARSATPPLKKPQSSLLPSTSLPSSGRTTNTSNSKKSSLSSVPRRNSHNYDSDGNSSCEDDDEDDFEDDINDDDEDINSSSDSENGYRAHVYSHNFEKSSSTLSFYQYSISTNISSTNNSINFVPPTSPLVPSLFPNVPPYLAFSTDSDRGPTIPLHVHKILKWKLTTIMPKVVRRILMNSGFRLLKKTNDWMGTWGKHMKSPCFRTIRSYQKINHLPGSFKIGRKDSCWKNLQIQMIKHGKKEFGFMPKTYIIPQDLKMLRKSWPKYAQRNFKWIIKPPASARGTGIKVVNRWSQIPKRKPVIVQKYIERPFLINGSKFDLRLYVLVTSINPLRVYLYHDGLVRFASVKYSEKSDTLNDRCMHLTNYSINKFSSNYSKNEDINACQGHKWTIKSLWKYFEKRGINTIRLWGAFRNLILRTILAGENSINAMIKLNVESKYNCFELFGFDVLLDSELIPWLLEVNISPSLHSELPLDLHVKAPLVQAVLNTALYHIPPKLTIDQQKDLLNRHGLQGPLCFDKRLYVTYLSRAEKLKHQQFTRKSLEDRDDYLNDILENLTPDDIRCLITSEDELSRSSPLERIFPTQYTHKYLKYTETPRYYNRLLDAWENRYGKDRTTGINLLKELCEQKLHLDTPPAPMRRPIKIRTRTLLRRTIVRTTPVLSSSTATTATPLTTTTKTTTTKSYLALKTAVKSIKKRINNKRSSIPSSTLIKSQMLLKLKRIQQEQQQQQDSITKEDTTTATIQQSSQHQQQIQKSIHHHHHQQQLNNE